MNIKHPLLFSIGICLNIVIFTLIGFQLYLMFGEMSAYQLPSDVRPELQNVSVYVTPHPFHYSIFNQNDLFLGTYSDIGRFVKITNDTSALRSMGLTERQVLCHELCHYKWHVLMNDSEKAYFVNLSEQDHNQWWNYGGVDEFHSRWCEYHLEACYVR